MQEQLETNKYSEKDMEMMGVTPEEMEVKTTPEAKDQPEERKIEKVEPLSLEEIMAMPDEVPSDPDMAKRWLQGLTRLRLYKNRGIGGRYGVGSKTIWLDGILLAKKEDGWIFGHNYDSHVDNISDVESYFNKLERLVKLRDETRKNIIVNDLLSSGIEVDPQKYRDKYKSFQIHKDTTNGKEITYCSGLDESGNKFEIEHDEKKEEYSGRIRLKEQPELTQLMIALTAEESQRIYKHLREFVDVKPEQKLIDRIFELEDESSEQLLESSELLEIQIIEYNSKPAVELSGIYKEMKVDIVQQEGEIVYATINEMQVPKADAKLIFDKLSSLIEASRTTPYYHKDTFDPNHPAYNQVSDLPKAEREKYVDINRIWQTVDRPIHRFPEDDKGFITKEAADEYLKHSKQKFVRGGHTIDFYSHPEAIEGLHEEALKENEAGIHDAKPEQEKKDATDSEEIQKAA